MATPLSLNLNGKPAQTGADPQTPLLYVLRNELDRHRPAPAASTLHPRALAGRVAPACVAGLIDFTLLPRFLAP